MPRTAILAVEFLDVLTSDFVDLQICQMLELFFGCSSGFGTSGCWRFGISEFKSFLTSAFLYLLISRLLDFWSVGFRNLRDSEISESGM